MSTEDVPPIIWLTRGRTGGELDGRIEIWSVSPERHRYDDGDVLWLAPLALIDGHSVMNLGDLSVAEARAKFDVVTLACVHRIGALRIGDLAVWVGVAAAHRGAAFEACRYVIDEAKARVPIWKKEHYADGMSEWVNCATRSTAE